jgi:hypothetical protein
MMDDIYMLYLFYSCVIECIYSFGFGNTDNNFGFEQHYK